MKPNQSGISTITQPRHALWRVAAALGLACALAGPALAQSAAAKAPAAEAKANTVVVELQQFKVLKQTDGTEKLVDAATVKPGDVIEYRARYINRDARSVSGLQATLPVPVGMEYVPRTARPDAARVQAATKDGRFAAEPLKREVSQPDGKVRLEAVPYAEYRALRWDLGLLPAGGVTEVTARVHVSTTPDTSVASR